MTPLRHSLPLTPIPFTPSPSPDISRERGKGPGVRGEGKRRIAPLLFPLLLAACSLSPAAPPAPEPVPLHPVSPMESGGGFIRNPHPPSTLLPAGTTTIDLSVETAAADSCTYSIGTEASSGAKIPFAEGAGHTIHRTTIGGLDPDPSSVNRISVGCASTSERLELMYRSLPAADPSFPRTGNLWGQWNFEDGDPARISRIDLWMGAELDPARIRALRRLNPHVLILPAINAVENSGLPDDYYLKDIHGQRVEVWPGSYRLNLTKPEVADYQAELAYKIILDNDLMYDGMFFDNVMTSQSWQTADIYDRPFEVDSDGDGIRDDPAAFDAAWKAGVFREIRTFRELMPHAIVSGHSMWIDEPGIAELFNGISAGFAPADVLEGERSFSEVWDEYGKWMTLAAEPRITMFEASPPDQIAYGYDYSPWDKVPPGTLEFARTMYPYMRFGLGLTLMDDGYFAYEFGDTWHGNDWWYDELDFDLGFPREPARRIALGAAPAPEPLPEGNFEVWSGDGPWGYWVDEESGYRASFALDEERPGEGGSSARADISAAPGEDWRISLYSDGFALTQGETYDVVFQARADRKFPLTAGVQKNSPDWRSYGMSALFTLTADWREYTYTFEATGTDPSARLQFLLGTSPGSVWIDDVRVGIHPPEIFAREYDNGLVLLNPTRAEQTVVLEPGWRRLTGDQAPRWERLVDDSGTGFAAAEAEPAALDSADHLATGPFYHSWSGGMHRVAGGGTAEWRLQIPESGDYSIDAWWPAAPEQSGWNTAARYEVRVNDSPVGSAVLDQTETGDVWRPLGSFTLPADGDIVVRLVCPGARPCAADALYLRSAARYNDGSPAREITLQPLDAIVLRRDE